MTLVLSRKKNESVVIDGGTIKIMVVEIRGDKVRLAFDYPSHVSVQREEVWEALQREGSPSAAARPAPMAVSPPPTVEPGTVLGPVSFLPPASPAASPERTGSPSAPSLDEAIETLRRAAERLSPDEAAAARTLLDAAKAKLK